jgi:glycerophosphoryl diester phosphodiesterase
MQVWGHRGAAGLKPENTLASIAHALHLGVDGIEIDVRAHGDSLIVMHDETLDRTTTGHGHHARYTLTQLRSFDAGDGERIPLLSEVLAVVRERTRLNVEVKSVGIAGAVLTELEQATRGCAAWRRQILVSAFDPATSAELAAGRGTMAFGLLYEEPFAQALSRARDLRARSLHMSLALLDANDVRTAQNAGLKVFVYTANTPDDYGRCLAAGVDAVFSDFPDRTLAARRQSDHQ